MASEEHLQIIRQGVEIWNEWRKKNPELIPDLRQANLRGENLRGASLFEAILYKADLSRADFSGANLYKADLYKADLSGANLIEANLIEANLREADLSRADLSRADLLEANLLEANLSGAILGAASLGGANLNGADLRGADLSNTQLILTNLCDTTLTGCSVFGASVWDITVNDQTNQKNLVITPYGQPVITVDNIKVAQFIYLLLNNEDIRDVIDTITSTAVLILGRFSKKRKLILDAIREELRKYKYLPIMFDFDAPSNPTVMETVKTLAGMSRFVIADVTDARSVPQELQIIDTNCRTVAVRLIKKRGAREYGMLKFRNSPWFVKGKYEYESKEKLIAMFKKRVVGPAEAKVKELRPK